MKKFILLLCLIPVFGWSQIKEIQTGSDKARQLVGSKPATGNERRVPPVEPLQYVNPMIGTGGHGHTFPGPVVPFGMVQVGPDTRPDGWDGCGGYHYSDSVIYGFSHTHLSGVGVPDYADILIVPQIGKAVTVPKYKDEKGYGYTFSHKNEDTHPGFYSVNLGGKIAVRLTATERAAIHEYSFLQAKGKKFIVIDLAYRDKVLEAEAVVVDKNHIVGKRVSAAWASEQHVYFDLQTNISFTKSKWVKDVKKGTYALILEFPETTKQVIVKVGLSGTSEQGATANLAAEMSDFTFDKYLIQAATQWRTELSKIQAYSSDPVILTNFYTALYHSYVHPSVWSDVDGKFRTFDQKIETSSTPVYSVFSLWDTYRGANPLYTILQPEKTREFIESFRLQYKNTGLLPVWTLSNNETNCMIGYHSVSIIADAAMKGIALKEPETLLEAMIASSNANQFGKKMYVDNGFVSANLEAESVSKTLEYAYDDWCIAQFARKIGNTTVATDYEKRAANWQNLLHPESLFFQPRKGGIWLSNFKPNEVNHHFTEANAWQYSMAAPHHIKALTAMRGGEKAMENFLDSLFFSSSKMSGREQSDITGLIGQYAHGNEPSHHMAYLYNYVGAPEKSQALLHQIMTEQYQNKPDGLAGNEDCGQMSAWYVLSAMGFYPVSPGSPTYAIGRPLLDRVLISAGQKPLLIVAKNNSSDNKYVQSLLWNGQPYTKLYITHDMIVAGGVFEMEMGPKPSATVAKFETDLNFKVSEEFVAVPHFFANATTFSDSIRVSIDKLPQETGQLMYRINNGDWYSWQSDTKNILLTETAQVSAQVVRSENGKTFYSPVVQTTFTKYSRNKSIELKTEYANQYAGGGSQGLVDGQRGTEEYRGTEWQGFQEKDVEAVITLDEAKEIVFVQVSALQDSRSWIFFPKEMTIEVSMNGVNYTKIASTKNTQVSDQQEGTIIDLLGTDFAPTMAKYVRIKIKNHGPCPVGHLGEGNPTWLFLDEIIIE